MSGGKRREGSNNRISSLNQVNPETGNQRKVGVCRQERQIQLQRVCCDPIVGVRQLYSHFVNGGPNARIND